MNSTPVDVLAAGLSAVLKEHGLERARADASWLQNVLADFSPHTQALNRVAALAAREGVPGWLQSAPPGTVDAVVAQAVSRLASNHAIDQGKAHDAVSAWAKALGVAYAGQRAPSQPAGAGGAGGTDPRIARRIEGLLDAAEAAERARDWQEALEAYDDILMIDPAHTGALQLRPVVQRRLGLSGAPAPPPPPTPNAAARPAPMPAVSTSPSWRAAWMSSCGQDTFGGWAAATIAGVEVRFRYCPAGRFRMGSSAIEAGQLLAEGPQHEVTLTQGFWLGEAPVTQRQWQGVAGSNPSHFKGAELPVEQVSWLECEAWMSQASARAGGLGLRFPTEAEWEYACRAGTTGATYRGGNDAATLDAIAWYAENSGSTTHPVKRKAPNPWGLYDMLGNVWEWCGDDRRRYTMSATTDPSGGMGAVRVNRGGSWYFGALFARAAFRNAHSPDDRHNYLGFRIARGR